MWHRFLVPPLVAAFAGCVDTAGPTGARPFVPAPPAETPGRPPCPFTEGALPRPAGSPTTAYVSTPPSGTGRRGVSRIELFADGTFLLSESGSPDGSYWDRGWGRFDYDGSEIHFKFEAPISAPGWQATGVISGDRMHLFYEEAMRLNSCDVAFEDREYVEQR